MKKKHRYAICGLSVRGLHKYVLPLLSINRSGGPNFDNRAELVGILDLDSKRVATFCKNVGHDIPWYAPNAVKRMVRD
jgi:predicted dehydrogenase